MSEVQAPKGPTYKIEKQGELLKVSFGTPAQNDQIVKDAYARLDEMIQAGELPGGDLLKITGPASLPVAMVIAHAVAHRYGAVGVFDPKLNKFVVSIAHGGKYQIGDLV
jgi:CRISPR-associated protein Csx3